MSGKKKTQKELIAELTEAIRELTRRVDHLESIRDRNHPWKPRNPKRSTKCPHCNGTGRCDDFDPYTPYYNGTF